TPSIEQGGDGARRGIVTVSNFHICTNGFGRLVERDPIDSLRNKLARLQALHFTDDDLVFRTLDPHDVERFLMCDAEASTLPDRVTVNPGMRSHSFTRRVDDRSALGHFVRAVFVLEIAIDKFRILPIGNKADLLRLLLLSRVE